MRQAHNLMVPGSNPGGPTPKSKLNPSYFEGFFDEQLLRLCDLIRIRRKYERFSLGLSVFSLFPVSVDHPVVTSSANVVRWSALRGSAGLQVLR